MAAGKRAERTRTAHKFAKVIEVLSKDRGITIGGGKGFGRGALKAKGRIFAMISSEDQFVVKLSKDRVDALVASAAGKRFEPRPGKLMKEWLVMTGLRLGRAGERGSRFRKTIPRRSR